MDEKKKDDVDMDLENSEGVGQQTRTSKLENPTADATDETPDKLKTSVPENETKREDEVKVKPEPSPGPPFHVCY